MDKTKTAIKHMMTEGDNETVDLFRVVFAIGIILVMAWGSYMLFHGKTTLSEFANAFLSVFGGGAAGTGIKSKLEGLATPRPPMPLMPVNGPQMPSMPVMPPRMPGQMPTRE